MVLLFILSGESNIMNSIAVQEKIQKLRIMLSRDYYIIVDIVQRLDASGGRAVLVGGAVRDTLLDKPLKDFDIEVYGLSLHQLEVVLSQFGYVRLVGKQFGVVRIDGIDIDWSIPRADGKGRKPSVTVDPHMPLKTAFSRRDLTMNAMGIDLITYELIDPFNGQRDIQQGILRAPDEERFIEDPLRFFRVMQFIGRFDMKPHASLQQLCLKMDISDISTERICQEFEKLFLKSVRPSLGLRWLKDLGRLAEVLPELYTTIGIKQEPDWHPEGDVFEHTMQSVDAAAQQDVIGQDKLILMYAALCHDLGKVTTTCFKDGRLRSHGHEVAGVQPARTLLERIVQKHKIIETVLKLVRYHMMPGQLVAQKSGVAAYKRLAHNLAPHTTMRMLCLLAIADKSGRNGLSPIPLKTPLGIDPDAFIKITQQAGVFDGPEAAVLTGKDLSDIVEPGPALGKMLAKAYEIQINNGITDKELLKKSIL